MAISFITSDHGTTTGGGTPSTVIFSVAVDDIVVVASAVNSTTATITPNISAGTVDAFTLVGSVAGASATAGSVFIHAGKVTALSGGTNIQMSVSCSDGSPFSCVWAIFRGCSKTTDFTTQTGTSTTNVSNPYTFGSMTTTNGGSVLIGCYSSQDTPGTWTPVFLSFNGFNWLQVAQEAGNQSMIVCYDILTGNISGFGCDVASSSNTTANITGVVVALQPAAAAAATSCKMQCGFVSFPI